MMSKTKVAKKSTTSKVSRGGGSGAHIKILNTVAALKRNLGKDEVDRKQLSALTGIQGKSTIANALTKLKNSNSMVVTPTKVSITDKGMEEADVSAVDPSDIPTDDVGYHEQVKKQFDLKPKACELFDAIADGRVHKKKVVA